MDPSKTRQFYILGNGIGEKPFCGQEVNVDGYGGWWIETWKREAPGSGWIGAGGEPSGFLDSLYNVRSGSDLLIPCSDSFPCLDRLLVADPTGKAGLSDWYAAFGRGSI
jgi:hypothetical protein